MEKFSCFRITVFSSHQGHYAYLIVADVEESSHDLKAGLEIDYCYVIRKLSTGFAWLGGILSYWKPFRTYMSLGLSTWFAWLGGMFSYWNPFPHFLILLDVQVSPTNLQSKAHTRTSLRQNCRGQDRASFNRGNDD